MKKFYGYVLALMVACSLFNNPKTLAWWNLIFPVKYEAEDEGEKEIKFFFVECFKALGLARKDKTM